MLPTVTAGFSICLFVVFSGQGQEFGSLCNLATLGKWSVRVILIIRFITLGGLVFEFDLHLLGIFFCGCELAARFL